MPSEVAERSATERARLTAGLSEEARRGFGSAQRGRVPARERPRPRVGRAWHGLGIALAALGDREGAADAFGHVVRQALRRAPLRAEALFNRSQMYDGLGDVEAAIEHLEECVALCQSGVAFPVFGDPEKESIFREEMVAKLERLRRDDDYVPRPGVTAAGRRRARLPSRRRGPVPTGVAHLLDRSGRCRSSTAAPATGPAGRASFGGSVRMSGVSAHRTARDAQTNPGRGLPDLAPVSAHEPARVIASMARRCRAQEKAVFKKQKNKPTRNVSASIATGATVIDINAARRRKAG